MIIISIISVIILFIFVAALISASRFKHNWHSYCKSCKIIVVDNSYTYCKRCGSHKENWKGVRKFVKQSKTAPEHYIYK